MIEDKNIWFHWERNATFTPIYMCMEGWAQPTTNYWGVPWPVTICSWKSDIISWDNKNQEFYDMGKIIVEKLLKSGSAGFESEIESTAAKITALMVKLDKIDLSITSEQELIKHFKDLHNLYIHWFVLGATEPPGVYGEKILEDLSKNKHNFSVLTSSTRKSFSKREFEELLQVKTEKDLETHAKKYFWLHNNYFTTEVLGTDFFRDESKKLKEKYLDPSAYLKELEKNDLQLVQEKQRIILQLNLSEKQKKLVELMEFFAWFQDYRKEYTMKMLHYLDILLAAIGRYHELSLKEMKHVLPSEIFNNKINPFVVKTRIHHIMVIWNPVAGDFEYYTTDTDIEQKKREIFGDKGHTKEIVEIEGSIASKGRVKGKAFVTMSAKDAKNIKEGEILVTSMTSPDFIAGIKKAAAIVTNEGGILCHAAIISREFGIPCIVGTGNATKLIKTGDMIEVDGNHGFVRISKD